MTEGPYKLPQGWRWVRLGEIVTHANGIWGKRDPNGVPVLRSTNFTDDGEINFDNVATIALSPRQVQKGSLKNGDILLERSGGGPNKPVGRVCIFKESDPSKTYCFGNFITVLRIASGNVVPEFLFHFLRWFHISGGTEELQTQTTNIRNLRFKEYLNAPIPLPPLPEQHRIVAKIEDIMARVREARRLRQQAREDAERLWQSVLAETFPRPGSDLPQGWRWVRLGEVAETKMGGTPSTKVAEYWEPPEVVWITPEDLNKNILTRVFTSRRFISRVGLENSSAKLFPARTVLLSTTATIGKVGIAEKELSANQQISGIICKDIDPEFLAYYLLGLGEARLRQLGGTATATHINQKSLRALPIPLPPLPEQRRIVAHLEEVRERIQALKKAQEETEARLKELERSILDKAFRGEL